MGKLGLCLSGGGAKGAYQIGACQALEDLGIYQNINIISGTSIGAANASIIASTTLEEAKNIWLSIEENPLVLDEPLRKKIRKEKLDLIKNGIFDLTALDALLLDHINPVNIRKKEVIVSVSDCGDQTKGFFNFLKSTSQHIIGKENKAIYVDLSKIDKAEIKETVKASCSIPIVFPPIYSENKRYYDGGIFDNTPIQPLVDRGCDEVILINIASFQPVRSLTKKFPNIKIHEIRTKNNLGGVLDFTAKHSKRIYDLGYNETMTYFKNLQTYDINNAKG